MLTVHKSTDTTYGSIATKLLTSNFILEGAYQLLYIKNSSDRAITILEVSVLSPLDISVANATGFDLLDPELTNFNLIYSSSTSPVVQLLPNESLPVMLKADINELVEHTKNSVTLEIAHV